ncbi:12551_t:CDS:2, partial [Cetraspora pellucida]
LDINEPDSSISEAETLASTSSNLIKSYKKNKSKSSQSNRINKSHTSYFFYKDSEDNNIAYCIVYKNFDSKNKKPYPYSCKEVYPYIYTLKQMFALRTKDDETVDSYLDLIYRPLISDNNLDNIKDNSNNSSFTSDNDDFPTAEN